MLLFNSKALLSQQKLCDAAVNFICVPKFTATSRGPPCDSVASCVVFTLRRVIDTTARQWVENWSSRLHQVEGGYFEHSLS